MKFSFNLCKNQLPMDVFKRLSNYSVVPGNGAFKRGSDHIEISESIIIETTSYLNMRVPGQVWSYTLHDNGAFHLNPENGKRYVLEVGNGESQPMSAEAAGMAWSLSAFYLNGISMEGHAKFVYLDKCYELATVIDMHPEAQVIYAAQTCFVLDLENG